MTENTFSIDSSGYAKSRPQYPGELFDWLANKSVSKELAWDCATGNGQSAVSLAAYFNRVYASDVSKEQIENAIRHPNVFYFVNAVENSGFPDNSFDLITAAQSLHWFKFSEFWKEVKRVAKRNAIFSAWGYDWAFSTPEIDEVLISPFRRVIEPFWNPRNSILWRGYIDEDISFPFERIDMPAFRISEQWSVEKLINYFYTWSAYKLADNEARGKLAKIVEDTAKMINLNEIIPVNMPLKSFTGVIK